MSTLVEGFKAEHLLFNDKSILFEVKYEAIVSSLVKRLNRTAERIDDYYSEQDTLTEEEKEVWGIIKDFIKGKEDKELGLELRLQVLKDSGLFQDEEGLEELAVMWQEG